MPNWFRSLARFWGDRPALPLEAKRSRTGPLIALQTSRQPVWTPRNYAALAKEGFDTNAVGYRCVRMIAEAAASVEWLLYEDEHEPCSTSSLGPTRLRTAARSWRRFTVISTSPETPTWRRQASMACCASYMPCVPTACAW